MFPNNPEMYKDYPLQSTLFGHRFKQSESLYEYILEFLLVSISKKQFNNAEELQVFFPLDNRVYKEELIYKPEAMIGLKRFIFFEKSKQEGRFLMDSLAYEKCIESIKEKVEVEINSEFMNEDYVVRILQNLLYGFNSVTQNRSWFAQSLLPICKEAIFPEMMGEKKKRDKVDDEITFIEEVDKVFETNRYNFMCRGGEVYYLHVLKAINDFPNYKDGIEKGLDILLNQFDEFSQLCKFINDCWINHDYPNEVIPKPIEKKLGCIPDGFDKREEKTLKELTNILRSSMHPFEKIEVLSHGIIFQIITMTHEQARYSTNSQPGYWLADINCRIGNSHEEVKKLAMKSYSSYEEDFIKCIYENIGDKRNKTNKNEDKSEQETINDVIEDSIKVYRKLGKSIGIIRPINEKGIRFTINETILKFLVTALIAPNTKMTLDRFLTKIYNHFNIVIGEEEFKNEIKKGNAKEINDISFLTKNKEDFQVMLKESGFLRELSDSTCIVENPYKGEF